MMTSLPRSLVDLVKRSSSGLYCSVYSSICFFSASGSSSPYGGMLVGEGRSCRRDLGKALYLGLKGEKGERRTGVEGNRDFSLDFVCVGEGECGERERRVPP